MGTKGNVATGSAQGWRGGGRGGSTPANASRQTFCRIEFGEVCEQNAGCPAKPGVDYQPVVVPNGKTLPCMKSTGVKVFHLIAVEVDHEICCGASRHLLGLQRVHPWSADRGGGWGPSEDFCDQPSQGTDIGPLARASSSQWDGRVGG